MPSALTPQQSLAIVYARLHRLRDDLDVAEPNSLEPLCGDLNRALDDLHTAGFDLSAFRLDGEEQVGDRSGWVWIA